MGPQPDGGAAPMETEEVMVKKKRTKKVAVPVVPHTLSLTETEVAVSAFARGVFASCAAQTGAAAALVLAITNEWRADNLIVGACMD